jgi:hypothetical protein
MSDVAAVRAEIQRLSAEQDKIRATPITIGMEQHHIDSARIHADALGQEIRRLEGMVHYLVQLPRA